MLRDDEPGIQDAARARVYGVEYGNVLVPGIGADDTNPGRAEEAPCAVCQSKKKSLLMIPATNQCLTGWATEYTGFLVATNAVGQHRSEFVCLGEDSEKALYSNPSSSGHGRFVQAEAKCGALPCDPYINNADLLCVVCSR